MIRVKTADLPPTPRQLEVLEYIGAYQDANGYPPTIAEIGLEFGIASKNGVKCHLDSLRTKGLLGWRDGRNRTLRILNAPAAENGEDRLTDIRVLHSGGLVMTGDIDWLIAEVERLRKGRDS